MNLSSWMNATVDGQLLVNNPVRSSDDESVHAIIY
jgi:hypothetical protein